jgi:hypothetical protein
MIYSIIKIHVDAPVLFCFVFHIYSNCLCDHLILAGLISFG